MKKKSIIKPIKKKRTKPFPAGGRSKKLLESQGWQVAVVEQTIPHTFIKRDAYGFADLLCCAPGRGIMLVQSTGGLSTSNFHARAAKIIAEPRHAVWLASGGKIQVHSWEGKGNKRECRILDIVKPCPPRPTKNK